MPTAKEVAFEIHRDAMYGDQPYSVHLDEVVTVMSRYGVREHDLLDAGYLHDSIEDTPTTKEDLERLVGPTVARIVDAVTDGKGKNREERKERPYRLIPKVYGALTVKLADRVANVEATIKNGKTGLFEMYKKEQPEFRRRLRAAPGKIESSPERRMWNRLAELLG